MPDQYISPAGAWAFAIGTSIGWGSLVVTSNTYLSQAGILGSILGMVLGAAAMLIISRNYAYLMQCYPEAGGAYTYAKEVYGYDHGFLAAWFVSITYLAILWANATSLPLFVRYFLGGIFHFGRLYTLFGYEVYLGEALLPIAAIALTTIFLMNHKRGAARLMVVLAVRSVTLEGAADGLAFYLIPNFKRAMEQGIWDVIFAAMGQAFFTLSLGIGSIAIFGSYIGKERSLPGESRTVIILDTFVAIMAGLIIFPSCFAYGVTPDAGPQLIFITLPEVFARMAGGRIWGTIFFIFMCFASLSTVIAVFENIIAMIMDAMDWSRGKSVAVNAVLLTLLSIPCPLGYNLLSRIRPLGAGSTILDFEDFIVSNNLLPIGSLVFVLFCCARFGWGFDGFLKEANTGEGAKFGSGLQVYFRWVLPVIILVILVGGYINFFR